MAYNYDFNPWDDNFAANSSTNQQQQTGYSSAGGTGVYNTDGYSNPMAQYTGTGEQQYQYQDQQQYGQYDTNQQQQQQQPNEQQSAQAPPPPPSQSAFRRLLRKHVPLCGSLLDTMSGINLPFIDALVQHVNRDLLISKMFYFFFYSAFGSLFPLMGVYFKQLGMNPAQVGILTGVRPFIEIFSAPFWASLAERFHKSKALLLFSVFSWIVFTHSLAHIRPPASACVAFNDTDYVLYIPYSNNDLSNYDVNQLEENSEQNPTGTSENELFMKTPPASSSEAGAPGNFKSREYKGEILASEENQNDQRRKRRRRKRQTFDESKGSPAVRSSNNKNRFSYLLEQDDGEKDSLYESHLELDIDLENDFDDRLISDKDGDKGSDHHIAGASSFYEHDSGFDDRSEDSDELEQLNSKGVRFERSVGAKDVDDLLGESDEPEQEEQEGREEEEKPTKEQPKERWRDKEEKGGEMGDEEEHEGKGEGNRNNYGKSREPAMKASKQETRVTSTIPTTTTESSYETASQETSTVNKTKRIYKQRHKTPPTHIVGMSPITVEYAVNYNKERHGQFVTPMFSTIVYKLDDIKEVFFLLLLLISLGEFFSAPALTLADSVTLSYLGDNTDLYGRQRMFGSFSWAITLLLVGMALDNATSIADHPCGPHQRERSYTVCFIIFSLLMACAFLTATQFRFSYPKSNTPATGGQTLVATSTNNNTVITTTFDGSLAGAGNIDDVYASTQPRSIFNTAPPVNAPPPGDQHGGKEKFEFLDKWKSAVFAQRTWEVPEWVNVFRQFRNSLHLTYLFITWFLGCGVGLVFTFLFWHLQDVGGTPTLFGICSVINHISEILAYFFSFSFIKRFGHTRVLSVGLGCNVIRFLYVAFLTDPYYALPFELVQGITHAACFAACCSYISHVSKPELRTSTQGVMQGLHHGIGRACGALLGGYMINAIGSRASFCIYGLLSGCVLAGFLYVRKKASEMEDEEVKVDDSEALGGYGAPQGVPSAR